MPSGGIAPCIYRLCVAVADDMRRPVFVARDNQEWIAVRHGRRRLGRPDAVRLVRNGDRVVARDPRRDQGPVGAHRQFGQRRVGPAADLLGPPVLTVRLQPPAAADRPAVGMVVF